MIVEDLSLNELMIVEDLSLNELRKRYGIEKKDEYVIRIRDRYSKNNKGDNNNIDIVYYNGRKLFTIKNGKKNNDINIFDNIFRLNKANMEKAFNNNSNIIKATINLRNKLINYYQFELNKITIKSSSAIASKKTYIRIRMKRQVISILENLRRDLLDYIEKGFIADFDPESVYYKLLREKEYDLVIKKCDEQTTEDTEKSELSIEDIVNIEYICLKNCLFKKENEEEYTPYDNGKSGLAKPDIDLRIKEVLKKGDISYKTRKIRGGKTARIITAKELEKFEKTLKNAVDNYNKNTKFDMEKIYQYQFMVRDTSYKCDEFKNMYKFEMEYPTNESAEDKGRIDNVFVKIDEDTNTAEAYLIELKVDEGVIGSTNGIHKHLIDIEKIYEQGRLVKFLEDLEERINYRLTELCGDGEKDKSEIKLNKNKLNFWVVIAISEKDGTYLNHAKEVQKMMNNLYDEEYIKNPENLLPENSEVLSNHIERLKKKKCDVKIMYDLWKSISISDKETNYNISNDVFFTDLDEYIKKLEK